MKETISNSSSVTSPLKLILPNQPQIAFTSPFISISIKNKEVQGIIEQSKQLNWGLNYILMDIMYLFLEYLAQVD